LKRIGIYFFCVVALGCVTSSILYRKSEMADEIRLEKAVQDEVSETTELYDTSQAQKEIIEVSDSHGTGERFLVKEEEGYLVIYDRVSMRLYDETTIQFQELPVRLQEKVAAGLYFVDEKELYAFLENYSS